MDYQSLLKLLEGIRQYTAPGHNSPVAGAPYGGSTAAVQGRPTPYEAPTPRFGSPVPYTGPNGAPSAGGAIVPGAGAPGGMPPQIGQMAPQLGGPSPINGFMPTSRTPAPYGGPGSAVATAGGGALANPSQALSTNVRPGIIDGEWSEVPRSLNGPKAAEAGVSLGDLVRSAGQKVSSALRPIGGLYYPMMMAAAQGDIQPVNPKSAFAQPQAPQAAPQAGPTPPISTNNTPGLTQPSPPISSSNYAPPPVIPSWASMGGPTQSGPFPQNGLPSWATNPAITHSAGFNPQAATPAPQASVPMPQARPAAAPQAPQDSGMNWWQRNAAMMRDPITGGFIDPTAAAKAQNGGPELIKRMYKYINDQADNASKFGG